MTAKIYTKREDTSVPLRVNTDLTDAVVRVLCAQEGPATELFYTITDAARGEITAVTESLAVGSYRLEVEVIKGGIRATYPNRGYTILVVGADLG